MIWESGECLDVHIAPRLHERRKAGRERTRVEDEIVVHFLIPSFVNL